MLLLQIMAVTIISSSGITQALLLTRTNANNGLNSNFSQMTNVSAVCDKKLQEIFLRRQKRFVFFRKGSVFVVCKFANYKELLINLLMTDARYHWQIPDRCLSAWLK